MNRGGNGGILAAEGGLGGKDAAVPGSWGASPDSTLDFSGEPVTMRAILF
jgi:hypothetical protein